MKRLILSVISILFLAVLISCDFNNMPETQTQPINWLDAPSLKEAFVDGGYFDRFGLACELGEISNSEIAKG